MPGPSRRSSGSSRRRTAPASPMVYLVDSAGARITDQVDLFPGRRGAGRIFWNQVRASGSIPQVCALFGPSAAGGAYIPAFCDVVVDGRGQRVDVPRLGPDGRDGDRREDDAGGDGRRRGCTARSPASGTSWSRPSTRRWTTVRRYLSYLPSNWQGVAARRPNRPTAGRRSTWPRWCRTASGRRSTCAGTCAGWSTKARSSRSTRCGPAS